MKQKELLFMNQIFLLFKNEGLIFLIDRFILPIRLVKEKLRDQSCLSVSLVPGHGILLFTGYEGYILN